MNATTSEQAHSGTGARIADGPILFFDGVCGLCNRSVDFVMARDRNRVFRFAPLQGETARGALETSDTENLNSVVLKLPEGVYRKSAAAVRVLWNLPGVWPAMGWLLWLIPRPLRDLGYRFIAANRYRLFGQKETCRLPTPEEAGRLLP